jgi:hypothetical protein
MLEMRSDSGQRQHVIETALALLLVSLLITASFWVLMPFVGALTYAVILSIPRQFDRMIKLLNGRRRLAALLFGLIAAAIMIVPLIYLSIAVADYVGVVEARLAAATSHGIPTCPRGSAASRCSEEGDAAMAGAAARWSGVSGKVPTPAHGRRGLAAESKHEPHGGGARDTLGIIMAAMIHASRIEALRYVSAITEHSWSECGRSAGRRGEP